MKSDCTIKPFPCLSQAPTFILLGNSNTHSIETANGRSQHGIQKCHKTKHSANQSHQAIVRLAQSHKRPSATKQPDGDCVQRSSVSRYNIKKNAPRPCHKANPPHPSAPTDDLGTKPFIQAPRGRSSSFSADPPCGRGTSRWPCGPRRRPTDRGPRRDGPRRSRPG